MKKWPEMLSRLPEEIQVEVFLRLPVRSIGTCRCVCKPFRKLLCNTKFIMDHHLHGKNNKSPRLMLISNSVPGQAPLYRSIDSASISVSIEATITLTCDANIPVMTNNFLRQYYNQMQVVGSCNGLICICLTHYELYTPFCIWNPATGEHKIVQSFRFTPAETSTTVRYGFGYDSRLKDYKLLKIVGRWAEGVHQGYSQVEVCALRSNSYKTIQCMHPYFVHPLAICLMNGALHWQGFVQDTSSWVIVSFDISSERFVEFLYPQGGFNDRIPSQTLDQVGVLEGHLCLVVRSMNVYDKPIDVWLMQDYGVSESWIKKFSIQNTFHRCAFAFKLPPSSTNNESSMDTGSVKIYYDPRTDLTKCLDIRCLNSQPAVSYVESLISIPTFGREKKSNTKSLRSGRILI